MHVIPVVPMAIVASKFVEYNISIKLVALTKNIPIEGVLGDKILITCQSPTPLSKATPLGSVLLSHVALYISKRDARR